MEIEPRLRLANGHGARVRFFRCRLLLRFSWRPRMHCQSAGGSRPKLRPPRLSMNIGQFITRSRGNGPPVSEGRSRLFPSTNLFRGPRLGFRAAADMERKGVSDFKRHCNLRRCNCPGDAAIPGNSARLCFKHGKACCGLERTGGPDSGPADCARSWRSGDELCRQRSS